MTAPASQERCEYHTYAYDLTKWYLEGLNTYTPPTERISPSRIEVLAEETAVKIVDAWRRNGFIK